MKKDDVVWLNILDILAYLMRIKKVSEKVIFNFNLKLDKMEKSILNTYGSKLVEKIKIPIIFFCDEYIAKNILDNDQPKLQQSIINCSNGGDAFFNLLDAELAKNSDFIIYKLYLLLLREGFCGKYQDNNLAILGYINRLTDRQKEEEINNFVINNFVINNLEGKNFKKNILNRAVKYFDDLRWREFFGGVLAIYFASCLLFYRVFS